MNIMEVVKRENVGKIYEVRKQLDDVVLNYGKYKLDYVKGILDFIDSYGNIMTDEYYIESIVRFEFKEVEE